MISSKDYYWCVNFVLVLFYRLVATVNEGSDVEVDDQLLTSSDNVRMNPYYNNNNIAWILNITQGLSVFMFLLSSLAVWYDYICNTIHNSIKSCDQRQQLLSLICCHHDPSGWRCLVFKQESDGEEEESRHNNVLKIVKDLDKKSSKR